MTECAWFPCPQETSGDSVFCYFHTKRAKGYIQGYIPGPGLTQYKEPSAKVKAMIAALLAGVLAT